jgi:hypothetical protein
MQLSLEIWSSTDNRHERHFFIKDGAGASYQDGRYVFGYNPEIVSEDKVKRILEIIKETS